MANLSLQSGEIGSYFAKVAKVTLVHHTTLSSRMSAGWHGCADPLRITGVCRAGQFPRLPGAARPGVWLRAALQGDVSWHTCRSSGCMPGSAPATPTLCRVYAWPCRTSTATRCVTANDGRVLCHVIAAGRHWRRVCDPNRQGQGAHHGMRSHCSPGHCSARVCSLTSQRRRCWMRAKCPSGCASTTTTPRSHACPPLSAPTQCVHDISQCMHQHVRRA